MAAGDLILEQGDGTRSDNFLGYGVGIAKAEPTGGTSTIIGADTASWISAVEAGNERVLTQDGFEFDVNSKVNIAAGTQTYCPSGVTNIESYGVGSGAAIHFNGDNIFFGNFFMKPSIGQDVPNNPGTCMSFVDEEYTDGVYHYFVGSEPNSSQSSLSNDAPEHYNPWMNTAAADKTRRITLHGCYVINPTTKNKYMTAGSQDKPGGASNTYITQYRGHWAVNRRAPNVSDSIKMDIANGVQTSHAVGSPISGITIKRDAEVDIRACLIDDVAGTQADVRLVNDGDVQTKAYYSGVTSGATGDESLELNTPVLSWSSGQPESSSVLGSYTGKPVVENMTSSLRTTILGEVAGTYTVTLESAGGGSGTVGPYARHGMMMAVEPYEKRWKDWMWLRGQFKRFHWKGNWGYTTIEDNYKYAGLFPEGRNPLMVPARTIFTLGAL